MAGIGPPPKPPDQRARGNRASDGRRAVIPLRVIHAEPEAQPDLPTGVEWHPQTMKWWKMWADSPLSTNFTANDWSELIDTALIHTKYWEGDMRSATELRLRAAKFGATPEDRARLRIQFATAEEIEQKSKDRATNPQRSRERYSQPSKDGLWPLG